MLLRRSLYLTLEHDRAVDAHFNDAIPEVTPRRLL